MFGRGAACGKVYAVGTAQSGSGAECANADGAVGECASGEGACPFPGGRMSLHVCFFFLRGSFLWAMSV